MEQIYERAARLVKRTLDVEGALVIDVSHVDIIETVTAEACTQVTIHHAEAEGISGGVATGSNNINSNSDSRRSSSGASGSAKVGGSGGTSVKELCGEEHARLQEFFAKWPEGKISEGLVPAALRAFLPGRIQYALSECYFVGVFSHIFGMFIVVVRSCADIQCRQTAVCGFVCV